MKLSKATTFLALCAVSFLAVYPSEVQGEKALVVIETPVVPTSIIPTHVTTTIPATHTTVPVASTTIPTVPAVTTALPTTSVAPKPVTTTAPVPTTTTTSISPTSVPISSNNGTCLNSSTCLDNYVCVQTSANATTGVCQKPPQVCAMDPVMTCVTSADCPLAFSYCTLHDGQNVCTGMGTPGTSTECGSSSSSGNGLMTTVKYAGIAVGSVAVLGLAFALVRWQRRRQRSKMPAEMFGEIDYGMTNRNSAPAAKAVESYPFSSRPNAHGSDHAPPPSMAHDYNNGYDNNQYYEEPVGYNNKMQQDQYYGHDQYDNQYYGNHKEGGGYGGYDQHGSHGGGDGFYDNAGYDDYGHHGVGHPSPIAPPAAVAQATSPRHQNFNTMDNYGVEPSEPDFGGHGHGHGSGQGGYGGRY